MFVSNEQREEAGRNAALTEERQTELRAAFRRLEERLDAIEARLDRAGR